MQGSAHLMSVGGITVVAGDEAGARRPIPDAVLALCNRAVLRYPWTAARDPQHARVEVTAAA